MNIPAGIVLYRPDMDRLRENLEAICPQAAAVICVDNGSDNREEITRLLAEYPQTILIANESNVGIAKALNQICRRAADDGYGYVVTLDHDSVCPADMIAAYEEHLTEDAGLLCPVIKDRNHDLGTKGGEEPVTEITECITSASLVNLAAWEAVSGFDESMFIDGVDFDFCDRIRKKGYRIYRVNRVVLLHEIGNITVRRFLFWPVRVKNHGAFRKYYIARNTMVLARKRGGAGRIAKSYAQVAKQYLMVLLYEDNKKEKLSSVRRGFIDGRKAVIEKRWC